MESKKIKLTISGKPKKILKNFDTPNPYKKKSELMNFPKKWRNNEKEYDKENYKDGIQEQIFVHNTQKGISLHEFLVINNWFNDQNLSI